MRNCPVCGCSESSIISRLCSNMKILGEQFPESITNIVGCTECGLVYLQSEAEQKDYSSYYISDISKPVEYYEMFGETATDEYFEHITKKLQPYIYKNCKLIDIGSGMGELSLYLKEKLAIDVSVLDMKETCINVCKKKGLTAYNKSSVDELSFLEDKYDMVVLNHILEHIADLRLTMENVNKILKQDGYVFIELPDIEGYCDYAENNAPYSFLTYEHIVHFSENDLKNLISQFQFEIVECGKYFKKVSNYPSIWAILKKKGDLDKKINPSDNIQYIKNYMELCKKVINESLQAVIDDKTPLILWGIGASTALLLEDFSECNVIQLVDKNPLRQGVKYSIGDKDFSIQSPEEIQDENATIFVMSGPYKNSIKKQIQEMGLKNKVLTF